MENGLVPSGANFFSKFQKPHIKKSAIYYVLYSKVSGEAPEKFYAKKTSKIDAFFGLQKFCKTIKN